MRTLAACVGLASAVALGAMAWNTTQTRADDATPLPSFTVANVSGVLNSLNATNLKSVSLADGTPVISFEARGRGYVVALHACDKSHSSCIGLSVSAFFEAASFSPQVINKFNATYPFGKAYLLSDGTLVSSRYFIADDGIPRKNAKSEFFNYFGMTDVLVEFIKKNTVVAALPGGPQPASYPGSATSMSTNLHLETQNEQLRAARINPLH